MSELKNAKKFLLKMLRRTGGFNPMVHIITDRNRVGDTVVVCDGDSKKDKEAMVKATFAAVHATEKCGDRIKGLIFMADAWTLFGAAADEAMEKNIAPRHHHARKEAALVIRYDKDGTEAWMRPYARKKKIQFLSRKNRCLLYSDGKSDNIDDVDEMKEWSGWIHDNFKQINFQ